MNSYAGVITIVRFNWPWYAIAMLSTAIGIIVLGQWAPAQPWWALAAVGLGVGDTWLLLSLLVSHHIYDRSAIASGGWLRVDDAANVVILHAGHDEASAHIARLLPGATRWAFDFLDSADRMSASLRRARAQATTAASAVPLDRIPLPDACADLAVVIFAAHEIREEAARSRFFREVARIIGRRGRAVVVEHQRDAWNLLAYGPGCFHFLSRATWMRTFSQAGLQVARDDALTPWVHRFELRTTA